MTSLVQNMDNLQDWAVALLDTVLDDNHERRGQAFADFHAALLDRTSASGFVDILGDATSDDVIRALETVSECGMAVLNGKMSRDEAFRRVKEAV